MLIVESIFLVKPHRATMRLVVQEVRIELCRESYSLYSGIKYRMNAHRMLRRFGEAAV